LVRMVCVGGAKLFPTQSLALISDQMVSIS